MNYFGILIGFIFGLIGLFFFLGKRWRSQSRIICQPSAVEPEESWIPFVGSGFSFVKDPTKFLHDLCIRFGVDRPFFIHAFGFRLVFIFSAYGLRQFYRLRESDASFAEATRTLLGLKLPPETTAEGDMQLVRELMKPSLMQVYARTASQCCRTGLIPALQSSTGAASPKSISVDIFALMRRTIHELGFRCWAGEEAAGAYLDRLIAAFDVLDPEKTFVDLASLVRTVLTRRSAEYAALDEMEAIVKDILAARDQRDPAREPADTLDSLYQHYRQAAPHNPYRKVAIDIFILQVASLANLYSAISWLVINLAAHPETCQQVRDQAAQIIATHQQAAEDQAFDFTTSPKALAQWELVDACMQESLRLAQRSLTLRKVMTPITIELSEGGPQFTVAPGCYLATLLSVTNPFLKDPAAPANFTLSTGFDPSHFSQNIIRPELIDQPETVSTFGHGRHACPGRSFAMMISKIVLYHILAASTELSLEPGVVWPPPVPESQIGAVARTTHPVNIRLLLI